jgi:hypothetical protein
MRMGMGLGTGGEIGSRPARKSGAVNGCVVIVQALIFPPPILMDFSLLTTGPPPLLFKTYIQAPMAFDSILFLYYINLLPI